MRGRLEYLFQRYAQNSFTEVELEEFLSHVRSGKDDEVLRELMAKLYGNIQQSSTFEGTYIDGHGKLVLMKPERKRRRRLALPVAATVLLVLTAAYFFIRPSKQKALIARTVVFTGA